MLNGHPKPARQAQRVQVERPGWGAESGQNIILENKKR